MPCPCHPGNTEIGPRPNQPLLPSLTATGEIATWPTRSPTTSATSENASSPRARSASTMKSAVWLLCSAVAKAAAVSAWMAAMSAAASLRRV
ncbi:hypothetical protein G6F31_020760 [Rhizopus arrhizus]|nr:hypothetical protein G6F31_020760 [Rhizopus arrhizus]